MGNGSVRGGISYAYSAISYQDIGIDVFDDEVADIVYCAFSVVKRPGSDTLVVHGILMLGRE